MKVFLGQQPHLLIHQNRLMLKHKPHLKIIAIILIALAVLLSGCIKVKKTQKTATLLDTSNATKAQLIAKINRFAKVSSMRAKMDLKFEDNSFAKQGIAEKYKTANSEIVVQRPSKILLKVKVPFVGTDVAQMTSNGITFRVAILQDGGSGKYKKFVIGTNKADYSLLQEKVTEVNTGDSKETKKNISAFSNLRPQHFTDAILIFPADISKNRYTVSTILQEEINVKRLKKKDPTAWVLRGYYLLDEFVSDDKGVQKIKRRFWFDRVGGVNIARQQIFDSKGEIESDIVYGKIGSLTKNGGFQMPLQVTLTRPREKYKVTLKFQSPKSVKIGKKYKDIAFVLKNRWQLEEVDLDKKLKEVTSQQNLVIGVQNKETAAND